MRRLIFLILLIPINCLSNDISLARLYRNSSLELSYTYPNHIVTAGIKYNPSDIGIGLSYNPSKQHVFFQTEASIKTNPLLKCGTDLFVEQLNIIAEQHQIDSQIKTYTQQLRQKTFIKQKNEFHYLKSILKNKLNKHDPNCSESEAIIEKLEVYYGQ